jgi:hypothetical protein
MDKEQKKQGKFGVVENFNLKNLNNSNKWLEECIKE